MRGDVRYGAILADPPWLYATWSGKGRDRCPDARPFKGAPARHYDVMTLADIKALPVASWAAPDCALFLWATTPMLPQALDVMATWGFAYKATAFVWAKPNRKSPGWAIGTGHWTRANAELCLFGTRGKPKRKSRAVRQLIVEPRREHSRKPDCTRERIMALVDGPYLEMFARSTLPGWDAWGDQVGRFDEAAA